MATERYKIGTFPMPEWVRCGLTPYRRMDGAVGFEYYDKNTIVSLEVGDELVKSGSYIKVKRGKRNGTN